jgi:hypothetical protein
MDFTEFGVVSTDWLEFLRLCPPIDLPSIAPGSDPKMAREIAEKSHANLPAQSTISKSSKTLPLLQNLRTNSKSTQRVQPYHWEI